MLFANFTPGKVIEISELIRLSTLKSALTSLTCFNPKYPPYGINRPIFSTQVIYERLCGTMKYIICLVVTDTSLSSDYAL